jgi:hypothetical protein
LVAQQSLHRREQSLVNHIRQLEQSEAFIATLFSLVTVSTSGRSMYNSQASFVLEAAGEMFATPFHMHSGVDSNDHYGFHHATHTLTTRLLVTFLLLQHHHKLPTPPHHQQQPHSLN